MFPWVCHSVLWVLCSVLCIPGFAGTVIFLVFSWYCVGSWLLWGAACDLCLVIMRCYIFIVWFWYSLCSTGIYYCVFIVDCVLGGWVGCRAVRGCFVPVFLCVVWLYSSLWFWVSIACDVLCCSGVCV